MLSADFFIQMRRLGSFLFHVAMNGMAARDKMFAMLDEPTRNHDSLNEAVVLKSLQEEREGKTVVLVSHRESTMRIADRVYSVENGRMS